MCQLEERFLCVRLSRSCFADLRDFAASVPTASLTGTYRLPFRPTAAFRPFFTLTARDRPMRVSERASEFRVWGLDLGSRRWRSGGLGCCKGLARLRGLGRRGFKSVGFRILGMLEFTLNWKPNQGSYETRDPSQAVP